MNNIKRPALLLLNVALTLGISLSYAQKTSVPPVHHNKVGDKIVCDDGELTVKCIGQKHGYGRGSTYDADIHSPKSAIFLPGGEKFYVNSLEGCKTVVYTTDSLKKLKTISHNFKNGNDGLWLKPSGYYNFTHYPGGESRSFGGKPVESALSNDGRYLFIPYYRRTFDINAQDPSALAVIDTNTDEIVLMTETGPLPKMVTVSNDGKLLAITHWGDNTVGFLDISDENPRNWHHLPPIVIGNKLKLNYSLTSSVNRDNGSGYSLRGTIFLPGDSLMLVCGMGGPTAIVDTKKMEWLGMIPSLTQMRHVVQANNKLYFSRNSSGEVYAVDLDNVVKAVREQRETSRNFKIDGISKVKVGGGARTLKTSPDGKYLFVACNSSSSLYIVDAEKMKVIGNLTVDSYPVGLDVSPDGSMIVVTSQGRSGRGGNAVNIFEVDYPTLKKGAQAAVAPVSPTPDNSSLASTAPAEPGNDPMNANSGIIWIVGGVVALIAVTAFIFRQRRV